GNETYNRVCEREGAIDVAERPGCRSVEPSRESVILFIWILLVGALNIQAVLWHYGYFQREAGEKVGLPELALQGLGRGGLDLDDGFSWRQCGSEKDPLQLSSLSILPSLFVIPGNLTLSLSAKVGVSLSSPIQAAVQMQYKFAFFWINVPCENRVGSCNYDDICTLIPYGPNDSCPSAFKEPNVPCRCPITQARFPPPRMDCGRIPGNYHLKDLLLNLNASGNSVPGGNYWVRVNFYDVRKNSQRLACFEFYFHIKHA
ncbi:unnamed protein product, partial [Darwinula stevensoni]